MLTTIRVAILASAASMLLLMVGCGGRGDVKGRLDKSVYASIDRHWEDDFGSKANYRVSDVNAGPDDLNIATEISNFGTLTLAQAVALGTAQSRQYQDSRDTLYLSGLNLRLTRHQFERRYFGVGHLGYSGDSDDELLSAEASAGFNHLLADGTEVGVALTTAWVDVLTGNLRGGLASILGVSIRKPLLRGSRREIVLESLTQAERDVLYQVRRFNRFRKTFVVAVISEYYHTLELLYQAQNAQDNIEFLQALHDRSVILYDNGQLSQIERDRIHQEVLQAQDDAVRAWQTYKQALDLFKRTLSIDPSVTFKLDSKELENLQQSSLTLPEVPDETAINVALALRLDLVNEAGRLQDAERQILVAQDRMRGELNIVGGGQGTSRRVGDPTTLKDTKNEGQLGVAFDLPMDRVTEEVGYRAAQLSRNQQERRYADLQDQIRLEVRQAYRNLEQAAERHQLQTEGQALAHDRRRVATLLQDYGRASTRRILEAQSDLIDAKNDRMEALVNYAIATLEFHRDTGILQVKPDGMWEL